MLLDAALTIRFIDGRGPFVARVEVELWSKNGALAVAPLEPGARPR
jgi:hypothetical protein